MSKPKDNQLTRYSLQHNILKINQYFTDSLLIFEIQITI